MKHLILYCIILFICSCTTVKENDDIILDQDQDDVSSFEEINIPSGFTFETLEKRSLKLNHSFFVEKMFVNVYTSEDMDEQSLIFSGEIQRENVLELNMKVPVSMDRLWIKSTTPCIQSYYEVPFNSSNRSITLSSLNAQNEKNTISSSSNSRSQSFSIPINTSLGDWDINGVPNYLYPTNDVMTQSFINDVTASLPDSKDVTVHSPEYIKEGSKDLKLIEEADIFITFFQENASYRNSLGYYIYDTNTPPLTQSDIDSVYMIYPNTSLKNSGGDLLCGNKVFLGHFPAGKSVGFVIIENGWQDDLNKINIWGEPKFSNLELNDYTTGTNRQHVVCLKDAQRERVIIGFEDVSRHLSYSDQDFNDIVFYTDILPFVALGNEFPAIKDSGDDDGDGVINSNDEFPNDPERAYLENLPSATLAFEDNWPEIGDYDFNDLVLNYSIQKVLNADYKIKDVNVALTINAIGGYYHNGFGFEWDFANSNIEKITGQNLSKGLTNTNANGSETGSSNTVIIAFEDAYSLMSAGSGESVINVVEGGHYVAPYTQNISITFVSNQVDNNELESLQNPFIFIEQDRSREVHLPNNSPTEKASNSFFGQKNDNSDVNTGSTYKSIDGAPWVIEIPGSFKYPEENIRIDEAFESFIDWVESAGITSDNWYDDKSSPLLYEK